MPPIYFLTFPNITTPFPFETHAQPPTTRATIAAPVAFFRQNIFWVTGSLNPKSSEKRHFFFCLAKCVDFWLRTYALENPSRVCPSSGCTHSVYSKSFCGGEGIELFCTYERPRREMLRLPRCMSHASTNKGDGREQSHRLLQVPQRSLQR